MNQYDLKEPPWVYSPTEVMDWINASYPVHKVKKSHVKRSKEIEYLEDIDISLDINVEKTIISPSNFFNELLEKITGLTYIEDHFEILPTTELIIRGLAKAKFHNMVKITLDNEIIYENAENGHDIRNTIKLLMEQTKLKKKGKSLEIIAKKNDNDGCIAVIHIQKIHPKKVHAINIKIKGRIEEYLFHEFLNYLRDHLSITVSND